MKRLLVLSVVVMMLGIQGVAVASPAKTSTSPLSTSEAFYLGIASTHAQIVDLSLNRIYALADNQVATFFDWQQRFSFETAIWQLEKDELEPMVPPKRFDSLHSDLLAMVTALNIVSAECLLSAQLGADQAYVEQCAIGLGNGGRLLESVKSQLADASKLLSTFDSEEG